MDSIAKVFPHDDVVARFVVSMAMARNDIEHASLAAGAATKNDAPAFTYLVRVAMGHTFEAVRALQHWCQVPEVKAFPRPAPVRSQEGARDGGRPRAARRRRRGGARARPDLPLSRPELALHAEQRRRTRPRPENGELPSGEGHSLRGRGKRFRLEFADEVALTLAFAKHDVADQTRLREQMDQVRDGGAALARVDCLLVLYADERQISFGSADDSRLTSAIRCVKVRPRHRPRSRGHHGRHCNFHIAWRRSSGRWPAGCVSPGVDMNLHDAAMTDLPFAGSLADPLAAALRVVLDVGQMRQFRAHQPATDTHCDA